MLGNKIERSATDPADSLPFSLDYLPEELKIRAKSELSEDETATNEKLRILRSLLNEEEGLRYQDDDLFLLAFLRVKKFDIKATVSTIKNFYSTLGKYGQIYYTINFDYLDKIMKENSCCILPYRDKEGSLIIFFRFTFWDYNAVSVEEHLICISLGLMIALLSPITQIAGVKIIADFKDFSMSHLLCITPSSMTFFIRMLQNVVPVRIQSVHVVNQNYLFSCMWSVCKYLAPKKIKERTHFHGSDLGSLHEFFSPSILPVEYGGDQPPLDNTEWRGIAEKSFDYIRHVVSFGYQKYLKKYRSSSESSR